MVVVRPDVWCDPCLAPLVAALNSGDLPTVQSRNGHPLATIASCCGHGRRPGTIALADGRWLIVASQAEYDERSHD